MLPDEAASVTTGAVSVTLALPVVLADKLAALVFGMDILPLPESRVRVPVEMLLPELFCNILPEPPAFSVLVLLVILPVI